LPPDVADWEPAGALYAGPDGLDAYRRLAPLIGPALAPGGIACVELGAGQMPAVSALFAAQGFAARSRADLAGTPRALVLTA
jgi:release factor glutamine methyltransferase